MKPSTILTTLLALALYTALATTPASAHKVKRNCMWQGQSVFWFHQTCREGDNQPRATPARSTRPSPPDKPDKPDCKDDEDNEDNEGNSYGNRREKGGD